MHLEIRKHEDVVMVDLQGKLTAGLGDQILHDAIDESWARTGDKILLNLSDVTFIDSAGIGELVSGSRWPKRGRPPEDPEHQRAGELDALHHPAAAPLRRLPRGAGRARGLRPPPESRSL